ncbi:MAG TPA: hypothetical protein V6D29_04295 [Leptolyngbyaceae cyanobacterium]
MPIKAPTQSDHHRADQLQAVNETLEVVSDLLRLAWAVPVFAGYIISRSLQCLALAIRARIFESNYQNSVFILNKTE